MKPFILFYIAVPLILFSLPHNISVVSQDFSLSLVFAVVLIELHNLLFLILDEFHLILHFFLHLFKQILRGLLSYKIFTYDFFLHSHNFNS